MNTHYHAEAIRVHKNFVSIVDKSGNVTSYELPIGKEIHVCHCAEGMKSQ